MFLDSSNDLDAKEAGGLRSKEEKEKLARQLPRPSSLILLKVSKPKLKGSAAPSTGADFLETWCYFQLLPNREVHRALVALAVPLANTLPYDPALGNPACPIILAQGSIYCYLNC